MITHGNISDWQKKTINFGSVKEKSVHHDFFFYSGAKTIHHVNPSCGCIAMISIEGGHRISFQWRADELPPHLETMSVNKTLYITFEDNSEDYCEISATITR